MWRTNRIKMKQTLKDIQNKGKLIAVTTSSVDHEKKEEATFVAH